MRTMMLISHNDARPIDGLSRSTRERLVKANLYPQPVQLTAGRVGFVRDEVESWARDRIAARDEGRDLTLDPVIKATGGKLRAHRLAA
jgi:prophage regulatory protein